MKRSNWFLISLIPLLFASCDRRTTAQLFLTVAFNASVSAARSQATSFDLPADVGFDYSRLASGLEQLRQLRQQTSSTSDLRNDTTRGLIEHISAQVDARCQKKTTSEIEATSLREIKWLALSAGVEIFPDLYREQHDACQQQLFAGSLTAHEAGGRSAQRFIRRYLVQQVHCDETLRALTLHSIAYPNCELNVELYLTTVEQFANRRQIPFAVMICQQGLERCAGREDVESLHAELDRIYAEHPGTPGVPMNFAGPLARGAKFELNSTRGDPTLVVFWASWCDACREELPVIRHLRLRYRDRGLQMVGVSLDQDHNQLTAFIEENQLDWPQVFTNKPELARWDNPIASYYGVTSIPQVFLLDRKGVVVAAHLQDGDEIEKAVSSLMRRDARRNGS